MYTQLKTNAVYPDLKDAEDEMSVTINFKLRDALDSCIIGNTTLLHR